MFGDEKQNIYGRDLEVDRRIRTNIRGRWNELTASFRLSDQIVHVARAYQDHFLKRRYDVDALEVIPEQQSLFNAPQHFEYFDLSGAADGVAAVFNLYSSLTERYAIHPNDVCILSARIPLLREVDFRIRTICRERTMTMFESKEAYNELCRNLSHDRELEDAVEGLRKTKKFHFWMNPGTVKLATIHSFKGWEINALILVLFPNQTTVRQTERAEGKELVSDEELVYTAITRCRHNLFIANFGDRKYHEFFSRIISRMKDNKA